ncbi:MAG: hypothetical protein EBR82_41710 [Caulobacteraceae bacterium]|nr:hypothetical protein [Caulobacteraceae bacterium]
MTYGFTKVQCYKCAVEFYMPDILEATCRRHTDQSFYCPNGHGQVYKTSITDELRRERDLLKQQIAQKDDEIRLEREAADKERKRLVRLQKRTAAGVCQCCNRTFTNVARHMQTKHPDFRTKLECVA